MLPADDGNDRQDECQGLPGRSAHGEELPNAQIVRSHISFFRNLPVYNFTFTSTSRYLFRDGAWENHSNDPMA
jgi:hypothetical protein